MRKKTLLLPFVYFAACFLAASAGYYIVGLVTFLIFGRAVVFGVPPHDVIPLYHYIHPFQYIAVVAFVYAWVASGWTLFRWHASNRWLRRAEILMVLIALVIVSLPLVSLLGPRHVCGICSDLILHRPGAVRRHRPDQRNRQVVSDGTPLA